MRKPTSTSPTERAAGLNTIYCSGSNSGRSSFRATRSNWSVCTWDPIALHCCSRQAWPDCRCGGRLATRGRSPLHDYSAVTTDVATARGPALIDDFAQVPQPEPEHDNRKDALSPLRPKAAAIQPSANTARCSGRPPALCTPPTGAGSKSYRVLTAYPEQVQRTAAPTHPTSQRRSS